MCRRRKKKLSGWKQYFYTEYLIMIVNLIKCKAFRLLTTRRSLKRKTSLWCAACFWALLTSVTSKSRLQHTSLLWGTERTWIWTQRETQPSKIILQTLMGCFQIIQKSRKREAKKPKSTFPPKARRYKTGAVEKTPLSTKWDNLVWHGHLFLSLKSTLKW